ncbi:MAG: helix-turn-helix domain-containing protein [Spirochaetota bacterium]
MDELIVNLGKKVRYYRTKKEMTLKDLAEKAGVTPSLLSQVEHGKASPSLATLKSLADVFNIPIGILFEMNDKGAASPLIRKNTYRRIVTDGNINYSLLTPGLDEMEVFLNDYPPDSMTGEKQYSHDGIECGYLIEGTLVVEVEDREYVMEAGDTVLFESYRPHRIVNRSGAAARAIWIETVPWLFKNE